MFSFPKTFLNAFFKDELSSAFNVKVLQRKNAADFRQTFSNTRQKFAKSFYRKACEVQSIFYTPYLLLRKKIFYFCYGTD